MRKIMFLLIILGLVFLAGPAEAAKKHHKHKKAHHHSQVARKAAAPSRVATRAEYNKLKSNMTLAQADSLFNAPRQLLSHSPVAISVQCPSDSKYFCLDDGSTYDNLIPNPGNVVTVGAENHYDWYTGKDKYDGSSCWGIYTEFSQDLQGVWRLKHWENWSNVCPTKYN